MPLSFNFGDENRPERFEGKPKSPVTLLSGFLGTGKTSLLKHLLENQAGVRIAVVVNDVAAVNIDSQLVRRYEKGSVEIAELQNGCVCCSSADDLFAAVQNVVLKAKDQPFEHIVVELSGVGEPEVVKRNWTIGMECTMPVALRTEVKRVVTVVDASMFGYDWLDTRRAQERNEQVDGDKHDDKNKARLENVGQLLAEQVEWADVIVVNKTDIASDDEVQTTLEVVRALNPSAAVSQASFGKVAPDVVLPPVPPGLTVPVGGECDGYRWAQTAKDVTVRMPIESSVKGRDIEFKAGKQSLKLGIKGRPSPRVDVELEAELKNVADVMWEIESSNAERCVMVVLEKRCGGMWSCLSKALASSFSPPVRDAVVSTPCEPCDPDSVAFKLRAPVPTPSRAEGRFGIHNFTFCRRRPFSGKRLRVLLESWPTPRKELFTLQDLAPVGAASTSDLASLLTPVVRSKGFCWIDTEPLRQHTWAHAGKTMSVQPTDWWWAALDKEQLEFKITYPGVESEYRVVRKEKWDAACGDRRQELVFIGGPQMHEAEIVTMLERCLLTDEEMDAFNESTRSLRVPNDDFNVNGLLKSLGASQDENTGMQASAADKKAEARQARRKDREETDYLRSLGVGSNLEPSDGESEEPPHIASPAISKRPGSLQVSSAVASSGYLQNGEPMHIPTTFEAVD